MPCDLIHMLLLLLTTYVPFSLSGTVVPLYDSQRSLLDEFNRYTIYSFGAYEPLCSNPVGNTLIEQWYDEGTDTEGYLVRDDARKELVAVFRGSSSVEDFFTDASFPLVQFQAPGISEESSRGCNVHFGFQDAFNSISKAVISNISSQLDEFPSYGLVSTGHSLGAAIASLTGVTLASNFPGKALRVYTFGQPRTGNADYASLVENLVGSDNIFRVVHTSDGVPTMVPTVLGYTHHASEYWFFEDPSNALHNFKLCNGREDQSCSDSILTTGINAAHLVYGGQRLQTCTPARYARAPTPDGESVLAISSY